VPSSRGSNPDHAERIGASADRRIGGSADRRVAVEERERVTTVRLVLYSTAMHTVGSIIIS
jgi:hypothetical protein